MLCSHKLSNPHTPPSAACLSLSFFFPLPPHFSTQCYILVDFNVFIESNCNILLCSLQPGYGPAGYALFVAVYAGLEVRYYYNAAGGILL